VAHDAKTSHAAAQLVCMPRNLDHDATELESHHDPVFCLSMIFPENRFPLFRIMV